MSRSRNSFFSSSSGTNDQKYPLLSREYDPHNDVNLHDLSSPSASRATPSPPPEFYKDIRSPTSTNARMISPRPISQSGSPSNMKGTGKAKGRRIQFAAPPPPIVGSVVGLGRGGKMGMILDGSGSPSLRGSLVREGRGVIGTLKGAGSSVGVSAQIDTLLGLERRESALQAELQMLLDAQGEGLLQGFGGGGGDREEGSGSSTPTTRSLQRDKEREGGRSKDGANMRTIPLVDVKGEESDLLGEEVKRREICIVKVKDWKIRTEEVKREIGESIAAAADTQIAGSISLDGERPQSAQGQSEEDREIAELQTEERAVENEIRETEDRLLQMKARKNWLAERIKERVNQRESRLSSYRGALREVEAEVQEFLTRPPVMVSISMENEEGFMALPPKRRTLEMAEEWWSKEIQSLQARKVEVEKEKEALEEGAKFWEESMGTVMEFEDELRKKMNSGEVGDVEGLKGQIVRMKEVIRKLGETAQVADSKGWNLLVCAVGAELQAFKQGEEILREALKAMGGDIDDDDDDNININNDDKSKFDKDKGKRNITNINTNTNTDTKTRTSSDDTSTDDGLKELETDLARHEQEQREQQQKSLLVYSKASFSVDGAHMDMDMDESDEEKHLKELLVDHAGDTDLEDHDGF
ncbi:hypothetical protein SBOR_0415 [Sclerotinia borealis F-4128]|uniref:Autophagy-related protein 28 n=1 Tax=Sclerotinia borealis (strain F-4128) TaxID=1432307 RepID=W9CSU3_SCLBF|nr:hypothetical protein SBOR_0415 [Sclerotinia borealis F-4128]